MKRVLACLLSCVLLFSIVGCGEKSAVFSNADLLSIVTGEWIKYSQFDSDYEAVTINEDGTAVILDNMYSWHLTDESSEIEDFKEANRIRIEILDDSKEVVDEILFERNYDYKLELDGTYIMKAGGGVLYNKKDFDAIEITTSNFFEYFEQRDLIFTHKDQFGDYTGFEFARGWALKEGFKTDSEKSRITCKFSHTVSSYRAEFNYETGDFTILEATSVWNNVYTAEESFGMTETDVFFAEVGMAFADSVSLNECPENIKLEAVVGTLYLYK